MATSIVSLGSFRASELSHAGANKSTVVHRLPKSAGCKARHEGRGNALGRYEGVPSLDAYREARRLAHEATVAANIKQMESALYRMLGAVASGRVTGLAFIEARAENEAGGVVISGSFVRNHGYLQRCLDTFSDLLDDHASEVQS